MPVHVTIHDAAGNRLGNGPVTVARSVSITRVLDAAGTVRVDFPETDEGVLNLIAAKRRAHVFWEPPGGTLSEIARMIIEKTSSKESRGSYIKSIDGPDSLNELKFRNTRRGRKYTEQSVDTIVDDLLALVPGWTRSGSVPGLTTARFDGPSVLKALRSLVVRKGIHFRQNPYGILEIGTFGQSSGITIVNRETAPPEFHGNPDVMLIESLTLVEDSEDIVNWIEPIGAGRGDSAITLEKSTRTSPYPIQSEIGPDGQSTFFIEDTDSQAQYGLVEIAAEFKGVTPVGTSEADQIAIANALYDQTVAHLQRYKDPYTSYSLTVRNVQRTLLPGDKIRIQDKFRIVDEAGTLLDVRDINDDFWVMEVSESLSVDRSLRLTVATSDRVAMDESEVVVGALESISVNNLSVEPFFCGYVVMDFFDIDPTHTANFEILVTERTQSMKICKLRVVSMPFRSNVTGAAAGGGEITTTGATGHRHTWASVLAAPGSTAGWSNQHFSFTDGSSFYLFEALSNFNPGSTTQVFALNEFPEHTHTIELDPHTHDLIYGIFDDSQYPADINITVNGLNVDFDLGTISTPIDLTYDITDWINNSPPLHKAHQVQIACQSGRGKIKVWIERWEIIQTVSAF